MDEVRRYLPQVSLDALRSTVFTLAKDPLPFRKVNYHVTGHDEHSLAEADAWISDQLTSFGYSVEKEACQVQPLGFDPEKPRRHSYAPPPPGTPFYTAYNIYAKKVGRTHPEEIILLLAHKDSQSWIDSPGAYDNCVGTAAVLEIARVLASYESERSIWFMLCNEEHTPWTSIAAAKACRERGDNLIAIFNIDAIGGKSEDDVKAGIKRNATLYNGSESKWLADLMVKVNGMYDIGLQQSIHQRRRPSDDDGSFVNEGYTNAICNIGSIPFEEPMYHLEGDTADRVDYENVRLATQANLAAVLHVDAGER